jgi:hypothetical protein
MRNIPLRLSFAAAIASLTVVATVSAAGALTEALESQNQAGFGDGITFVASGYTPPGIIDLVHRPLASQNQAGFGDAITFVASAYTPPGITDLTIKVVVAP